MGRLRPAGEMDEAMPGGRDREEQVRGARNAASDRFGRRTSSVADAAARCRRSTDRSLVGNVLRNRFAWLLLIAIGTLLPLVTVHAGEDSQTARVGSKRFTESYILGEIVTQTLRQGGRVAEHRPGLGNTGILEQALASGSIDVYPEYTGTIVRELLRREGNPTLAELNRWLAPRGLVAGVPLGFNNTYALAMTADAAERLGIHSLSDLASDKGASLRFGLSHEFIERGDGWPGLRRAYGFVNRPVGLDHGLAYDALAAGRIDVIDVYSTDAKLGRYGLVVLTDDRRFFPAYDALLLMRVGFDASLLATLSGSIDAAAMIAMNAEVELDRRPYTEVAARFVASRAAGAVAASASRPTGASAAERPVLSFRERLFADDFWRLTREHLLLVFASLALAVTVGVPIGIAAWRWPRGSAWLLGAVAVLQTVPSLAMLAFLIAALGRIGVVPALIALFLYALLPIVRNTHAGLAGVTNAMSQAGLSLGLTPRQTLRLVQLPLAAPTMLAGIKTAAVINVGTATMAAFIGAGGYGERIVAGLAVNDTDTMLAGALPAAVLAIAIQLVFDAVETRLLGSGRRLRRGGGAPD